MPTFSNWCRPRECNTFLGWVFYLWWDRGREHIRLFGFECHAVDEYHV